MRIKSLPSFKILNVLFSGLGLGILLSSNPLWAQSNAEALTQFITTHCGVCSEQLASKSGLYILEKGEESLITRGWLAENASASIDVQYFIWGNDNIGKLAAEFLLSAAERGVKVRVIADDLMVNAEANDGVLALNAHPNFAIKIYNPKHIVGVEIPERAVNVVTDFRGANQRMHDKAVIVDGIAGITGGRNMADEYFDYDEKYNFRDRDIFVVGAAVKQMQENFEEFWNSPLAVDIGEALDPKGTLAAKMDLPAIYRGLHEYAANPENFEPEVRDSLAAMSEVMPTVFEQLIWEDAVFINDTPGKNSNRFFLDGGGESSLALLNVIANAQHSVIIQSPYLVIPVELAETFETLRQRGVTIKISTNSLASTDNLLAFSGYQKQRQSLLEAGVEIYEFNPNPAIKTQLIERYPRIEKNNPIFALHAKSMTVDGNTVFIGSFNLDPRSANLNTEVGILVKSETLAQQLTEAIERDMLPENSWRTTLERNPDHNASFFKRSKVFFLRLLPLEPVL